jgi:hypothetical protein
MREGSGQGRLPRRSNCKGPLGLPCAVTPEGLGRAIGVRLAVPGLSLYPVNSVEAIVFHGIACGKGLEEQESTRSVKVRGEVVPSEERSCKRQAFSKARSGQLIELVGNRFEHIPTRPQGAGDAVFSAIQ